MDDNRKMDSKKLFERYLNILAKEGVCRSPRYLASYLKYLFQEISFDGKIMLDIGGGYGVYSFYAAIQRAKYVICLEPEVEGSEKGVLEKFKKFSTIFSLNNIGLQPVRFQDFDPDDQLFDIILLHNSINHLDEQACIRLQHDGDARRKYGLIFQKLNKIATPGAKLIIADCSRHNFFASLGIKNPFEPKIEWHKHQSPEFWGNLLSRYGFINPKIRWIPPIYLGKIGRLLFGNRFASYFLTSRFILTMDKSAFENRAFKADV